MNGFDLASGVTADLTNSRIRQDLRNPIRYTRQDYEEGIEKMTRYLTDGEKKDPTTAAKEAKKHWDAKCPQFASKEANA